MKTEPQFKAARRAFTMVEMLVVIVVVGVLIILLLPLGGRMREKSQCTQCLNNLKKLGAAVSLYANEHEHYLPVAERQPTNPVFPTNALPRICDVLSNYVAGAIGVFICPNDQTGYHFREGSSYEWNYTFNATRVGESVSPGGSPAPQEMPLMYDYANVHRTPRGQTKNVLFANGHAESL